MKKIYHPLSILTFPVMEMGVGDHCHPSDGLHKDKNNIVQRLFLLTTKRQEDQPVYKIVTCDFF